MKKFNFSLERVLKFQKQNLDKTKFELAALVSELNEIESEIDKLNQKCKNINNELKSQSSVSISILMMKSYMDYIHNIYILIKEQEAKKQIICDEIQNKQQELLEKHKEVKILDRLKEKELEKYNYELMKKEEKELEEFISYKIATKESI